MTVRDPLEQLATSRQRFVEFVRRRVRDDERAEDIVQASLARAVESFDSLREQDRLAPWFYSILRNAITDSYRQGARSKEVSLPPELDLEDEQYIERQLCECFAALLPALQPQYAELIERLDLQGEQSAAAAEDMGISANNLKVRHHRARQALKRRLQETCRVCAEHHCLDCTCRETD
jgi:RNA polymerase sigma-70 factor (ECF subfamily)